MTPETGAPFTTIDDIIEALYRNISGPAGAKRLWLENALLFGPGARLMPISREESGVTRLEVLTPESYATTRADYFAHNDFYETELARRTERYGAVAHVWSTYVARRTPDGPAFLRGINSIQLVWREERWWVISILWDQEQANDPIPDAYLLTPSGA